jgi:prepilin peptidase CpaA
MQAALSLGSLAGLAILLVTAAVGDARRYIIPNRLCAAVAALSLPYWIGAGVALWPDLAWQAAFALIVLLLFAGLFAAGLMGGGDVKLIAALALWLPIDRFLVMAAVMAIAGGVLTLALLVRHRMRRREGRPEIPYGVAIAVGAAVALGEEIVKHFQS